MPDQRQFAVGKLKDASYVDINRNDDLASLLTTGFQPVNTNRARIVLNPPDSSMKDNMNPVGVERSVTRVFRSIHNPLLASLMRARPRTRKCSTLAKRASINDLD